MSIETINQKLRTIADFVFTAADLKDVGGFLEGIEGYALYVLAHDGPGEGAVVEIGSFMGLSTCWLALGSKKAGREPVTAVDHFTGSPEHQPGQEAASAELEAEGTTFHRFEANIERLKVDDHVRPIRASSEEAVKGWMDPIRLLFIDGDHSYEGVRSDFTLWTPYVVPGGVVALHDVGTSPEVTRFYEEQRAPGRGFQEYFRVLGLAVLLKD